MHLMLQNPRLTIMWSRREDPLGARFCAKAFQLVGLDWEKYVVTDEKFHRPAEVDLLVGDSSKARATLEWETDF